MRKVFFLLTILILSFPLMAIEEPSYSVISTQGDIEFRQYASFIVARTTLPKELDRDEAANAAFRILFRYIQGANSTDAKIAMTAPVLQDKGRKIEMTAPVIQESGAGGWRVAFVLPAEFNMDNAPLPMDARIKIEEVPERKIAVLRYSGRWTEQNVQKYSERLLKGITAIGVTPIGAVESAYYNAPFVPPFIRRNEVLVQVDRMP